jgi:translation initiation factor 2 alpha subunit (eIF-2alpha)
LALWKLFRNIRDFVRERQKVVLKVLRVDVEKGHIDLSLRRVTKREKIEKILSWKRERKAEALLRRVAEKAGLSVEDVYEKAGALIDKECGLYEGFEKAAKEGVEVLTKIGVPEELAEVFVEVVRERIRVPMVKIKGVVELRCFRPDGVKIIKEAFLNAKKLRRRGTRKSGFTSWQRLSTALRSQPIIINMRKPYCRGLRKPLFQMLLMLEDKAFSEGKNSGLASEKM